MLAVETRVTRDEADRLLAFLDGVPAVEQTVGYTLLDAPSRETVDAAVFRITRMNEALTRAQEAGDRAGVLIIEGQLAALRA